MRPDDITRAVLARDDVAKYLRGQAGGPDADARERIEGYLDELRTTQRYRFYRALQHPLYPILRKVQRIAEHVEHAIDGVRRGRVVYVSNHKSHLDYLVEPLVLDDNGIRPPLLAAGINLFGGALGPAASPRHRRDSDPPQQQGSAVPRDAARVHRRAAEAARPALLRGGRTQLQRRAASRRRPACCRPRFRPIASDLSIVPMAVAYDLVLEERIISREASRKRVAAVRAGNRGDGPARGRLPSARVRHVRRSRFRWPTTIRIRAAIWSRSTHRVHDAIGRLLQGAADGARRRRHAAADVDAPSSRIALDDLSACSRAEGANLAVHTARQAARRRRSSSLGERGVARRRGRRASACATGSSLRYYARTIEHLLAAPRRTTH